MLSCIAISVAVAAIDHLFKLWIITNIKYMEFRDVLPGVFGLTNIRNTGASFSMFDDSQWAVAVISVLLMAVIVYFLIKGDFTPWEKVCASCVLGGAFANFLDRIIRGYVVDMIKVTFVDFAVFNLADCFIDVGGIAFCILFMIRTAKEEKKKKTEKTAAEGETENDADHS